MRKGYSDGPLGQIHWRMIEPADEASQPDLYCLHPAPFTGVAFAAIMPFLAKSRRVFAPDFPGHGGSDPFHGKPAIGDYAAAIEAVVNDKSRGTPADFMGFHSGCLVAAEMAICAPTKTGRLVLVDVPAFDPDTRAKFLDGASAPLALSPDMESLRPAWQRAIDKRIESQNLERCFEMFVEQLRHGANMNSAFHAAFTYDVEGQLSKLDCPVDIIASQSTLLDASRRAADLIPQAQLTERLDITRAVLDEAAETIAQDVLRALNADRG